VDAAGAFLKEQGMPKSIHRHLVADSAWPRAALVTTVALLVSVPIPASPASATHASDSNQGVAGMVTELAPPPLRVLRRHHVGRGDIFIAPAGGRYAAGPEIVTKSGKVVWFHRLLGGDVATDFRTQTYRGRPVLTWLQSQFGGLGAQDGPGGSNLLASVGVGYIYNERYRQIGTVQAGNGYTTDFHELLITPHNTALILADKTTTVDLRSIGGRADQRVIENVVQEINIRTGRVLFQWNAAKHIPYSDSYQGFPSSAKRPWDWLHLNAVHFDRDGNLLVSSRNTWTVYKVNRRTGRIMWQLGGKRSSFTMRAARGQTLDRAGKIYSWQHDPEAIGHRNYTFFDDETSGRLLRCSRVVTVHLNLARRRATVIGSDYQPEGLVARVMGNAQPTKARNRFVGWGSLPYLSEFSRGGQLLYNAELPPGVATYRAYLLPWHPAG
jgi:hypothetical protein